MSEQGWASKELESVYQTLWELRQKQTNLLVLQSLEDAMYAIEHVDDKLTDAS